MSEHSKFFFPLSFLEGILISYYGDIILLKYFQIFGMSLWNCGRDAMDALVELIINLVIVFLSLLLE